MKGKRKGYKMASGKLGSSIQLERIEGMTVYDPKWEEKKNESENDYGMAVLGVAGVLRENIYLFSSFFFYSKGCLVGDALRELPVARSRDSSPWPIIDRSPEKRWTCCVPHCLQYTLLYNIPLYIHPTNPCTYKVHIYLCSNE